MDELTPLDQIADRVQRLLQAHAALEASNEALVRQLAELQAERDLLRSRLRAARARIDALIERLPPGGASPENPA